MSCAKKYLRIFVLLLGISSIQQNQAVSIPDQLQTQLMVIGVVVAASSIIPLIPKIKKAFAPHKVGVVSIEGMITGSSLTIHELKEFFEDKSIDAIVIKINSGGGNAGASQCIYQAIGELRAQYPKPVIAWVEEMAASGAYYIAAAANAIIASPLAIIGSVGSYFEFGQYQEFLRQYKIEHKFIASGDYKVMNPLATLKSEQEALLQEASDSIYKRFVADMQAARSELAAKDPVQWANGKVFDGTRALEVGLVDALGCQLTVEKVIKKITKKESAITWVYPIQRKQNFLGYTIEMENNTPYLSVAVDKICERVLAHVYSAAAPRVQLKA